MLTIYKLRADAMSEKCLGNGQAAIAKWKESIDDFSQYDIILEPWFDMSQAAVSFNRIMRAIKPIADF